MLRHSVEVDGQPVERLGKEGCLGDMPWQPIGPRGPFEAKPEPQPSSSCPRARVIRSARTSRLPRRDRRAPRR